MAPGVSCCPPKPDATDNCHSSKKGHLDYMFWVSGAIVVICYSLYLFLDGDEALPRWLITMSHGIFELVNRMWWGLLAAVIFVGLLERIPKDLVISALGRGGTLRGVFRATLAGVLLDLCSHGILMVGTKLYERGASIGQVMAFLIASPWNSLSLTIVLVALVGLGWTLLFIGLSMAVGILTGVLFDHLTRLGKLPPSPHTPENNGEDLPPVLPQLTALFREGDFSPGSIGRVLVDGIKDSRIVFRWLLFGLVLASAIRALVPLDTYQTLFGPTIGGLLLTLFFATVIEVCSEGSTPIAADLLTRAAAPGNCFTFLMAGVATDYTEVMVLKDTTKSWKIALYLPLLALPQVMLIGWILNHFPA